MVDQASLSSASGKTALQVAVEAVRAAGGVLLEQFRRAGTVRWKGKSNVVTQADLLAERATISVLRREFPSHGVLAEESGSVAGDSGYTWTVDPLDGTNNYMFGLPFFCATVGLCRDGEVLVGATYDPLRDEMFCAEKGKGTLLNGAPAAVSSRDRLEKSLVGFDLGYVPDEGQQTLDIAARLWPRVHSLRLLGSAALSLAYVGAGRTDLYCHRCLYPWDIAAGMLLVREAGGLVTDWQGKRAGLESGRLVASNAALNPQFVDLVQSR